MSGPVRPTVGAGWESVDVRGPWIGARSMAEGVRKSLQTGGCVLPGIVEFAVALQRRGGGAK